MITEERFFVTCADRESNVLPISPIDGYRYSQDEVSYTPEYELISPSMPADKGQHPKRFLVVARRIAQLQPSI